MAFKRLSEVADQKVDLLTVRAKSASIFRGELVVRLDNDPEVLTCSRERRDHGQSSDRDWFNGGLSMIKDYAMPIIVANQSHPLEIVTGDVCVILVIEGKRYVISFFRDIWPQGWLCPGGCPKSFKELLDIVKVAAREVREELIIADDDNNIYSLSSPQNEAYHHDVLKVLRLYGQKQEFNFRRARVRELIPHPGHANQLMIYQNDKQLCNIVNLNLTVDPLTASVAATLYWEIELPIPLAKLHLFDGELLPNGSLLDRPIRLARKVALSEAPGNDKEEAVALFHSGEDALSLLRIDWINDAARSRFVDPKQPVL